MRLRNLCDFMFKSGGRVGLRQLHEQFNGADKRLVMNVIQRAHRAKYLNRLGGDKRNPGYELTDIGVVYAQEGKTYKQQKREDGTRLVLSAIAHLKVAEPDELINCLPFSHDKTYELLHELIERGQVEKFKIGVEVFYKITGSYQDWGRPKLGDRIPDKVKLFYQITTPRYPKYLVYHWSLRKCAEEDKRNAQLKRAA